MKIDVNVSVIAETKWYEYALRFFFGGLITAIAGIIAKAFGPAVGGLFLAFPAIFPASATLIEKHEKQKKEGRRAAEVVSVDAKGTAIGSIGLAVFAVLVCWAVPNHPAWVVLTGATLAWVTVSVLLWEFHKRL